MVISRTRSRSEPVDGEEFGTPVPPGTWHPGGDRPLVLSRAMGSTGVHIGVGWGVLGFALVFGVAFTHDILKVEDGPGAFGRRVSLTVFGTVAVVGLVALGTWAIRRATSRRAAEVIVGRWGISLMPGRQAIYWAELAWVGIVVRRRRVSRATVTDDVFLGLIPTTGNLAGRKLPRHGYQPLPPYTQVLVVSEADYGDDELNVCVVRDLDAALRHFAPRAYAGVDDRGSTWGPGSMFPRTDR